MVKRFAHLESPGHPRRAKPIVHDSIMTRATALRALRSCLEHGERGFGSDILLSALGICQRTSLESLKWMDARLEKEETRLENEYTQQAEEGFEIVRKEREELSALCNMLAIRPDRLLLAYGVLEELPARSSPLVIQEILNSMTDAGNALLCNAHVVIEETRSCSIGASPSLKGIELISSKLEQSLTTAAMREAAGSPFGSMVYVVAAVASGGGVN